MPRRGNGPAKGARKPPSPSPDCNGNDDSNGGSCGSSTNHVKVVVKKNPMQRLRELCVETFSEPSRDFSPEAIERLRCFLDTIKASDVGIKEIESSQLPEGNRASDSGVDGTSTRERSGRNRRARSHGRVRRPGTPARFTPAITYVHVYECHNFSIGIFCLPASAVLPLHNHPGMTVLSKILYGSLHWKSYDPVNDHRRDIQQSSRPPNSELAKVKVDTIYTAPCEPNILSPRTGGTIHCLTAVTACAMLDVLAPPYSDRDGRHCTYYRTSPCVSVHENGTAEHNIQTEELEDISTYFWLEGSTEVPEDFLVRGGQYKGLPLECK